MIMFLRQKLDEREFLKIKINELKSNILHFTDDQNNLIEQLLGLFDKLQTINLILNRVNYESIISIAGTQLSLATAIEIRTTLKSKIDIISELISKCYDSDLDLMTLMSQRDTIIEEFSTIDSAIRQADWHIKIE